MVTTDEKQTIAAKGGAIGENTAELGVAEENAAELGVFEGATAEASFAGASAAETGAAGVVATEAGVVEMAATQVDSGNRVYASAANLPTTDDLVAELIRVKKKRRSRRVIVGVFSVLIVVAAVAVLLATRFLPVLQVYGDSMSPTLNEGDIVVALDYGDLETGDVIAFYYNNKVLIKRVIAEAGDWVNVSDAGTVTVNGVVLDEPYVTDKSLGNSNIVWPYQVPESHVFVMGDHRSTSIDSRNTAVGCIAEDAIIGELMLRVWPLEAIGTL